MKRAAALLSLIIAIAVLTSAVMLTYGGRGRLAGTDIVAGRVWSVNHVLKQVIVNGTPVKFAGRWRCSGIKASMTAAQLLNMIRPEEWLRVVATHGILGLKAIKAYLPVAPHAI